MSAQDISLLISRLEGVAIKLEKASTSRGAPASSEIRGLLTRLRGSSPANWEVVLQSLTQTVEHLEQAVPNDEFQGASDEMAASVGAFGEITSGPMAHFTALSNKIGGDVQRQASMVQEAFEAQKRFLVVASRAKKPSQSDMASLLKPTSDKISQIQSFRESNRRSDFFNHLSAVSESIAALGWVAVSPAPAPHVKEMSDAAQFYSNRVLKEWKDKDKTHAEWVKAWIDTLSELQAFVKQHHTTGLVWNSKGGDAKTLAGGSATPGGSGPILPPPPPPKGLFDDIKIPKQQDPIKTARNALFAELNQGDAITKGLKKVTPDMQTHKNPHLKLGRAVPPVNSSRGTKASGPKGAATQKSPKLELEGKKWMVEYFKNDPNIEVGKTTPNQSVYIFKCDGSTIKIHGKCNTIIMDNCKKSAIVFDSVVSSIEFINCQSVQMQVLDQVPTISIDKTDGCQMYLSKSSLNAEMITAKSSEMNVLIPSGEDFVEQPIPEQFKTTISGTKLRTTTSEAL